MFSTFNARITLLVLAVVTLLRDRGRQFRRESERGDENVTKVMYALLAVVVGGLVAAAITAFVNGKLSLIGGH